MHSLCKYYVYIYIDMSQILCMWMYVYRYRYRCRYRCRYRYRYIYIDIDIDNMYIYIYIYICMYMYVFMWYMYSIYVRIGCLECVCVGPEPWRSTAVLESWIDASFLLHQPALSENLISAKQFRDGLTLARLALQQRIGASVSAKIRQGSRIFWFSFATVD